MCTCGGEGAAGWGDRQGTIDDFQVSGFVRRWGRRGGGEGGARGGEGEGEGEWEGGGGGEGGAGGEEESWVEEEEEHCPTRFKMSTTPASAIILPLLAFFERIPFSFRRERTLTGTSTSGYLK